MSRLRITVALILSALILASANAPAQAAGFTRSDRRGDAPAFIDITRYHVNNGRSRIYFTLKVRHLADRGSFFLGYDSPQLFWDGAGLVVKRRNGHVIRAFFHTDEDGQERVGCRGIRIAWRSRDNTLSVSWPQRCYSNATGNTIPRGWRIAVYGRWGGTYDDAATNRYVRRG